MQSLPRVVSFTRKGAAIEQCAAEQPTAERPEQSRW